MCTVILIIYPYLEGRRRTALYIPDIFKILTSEIKWLRVAKGAKNLLFNNKFNVLIFYYYTNKILYF